MTDATRTEPLEKEIRIEATPETVFEFFLDPEKMTRWLCDAATVDPRPGGAYLQTHPGPDGRDYHMRGELVEVSPPSRLVFTWGFEEPNMIVRPGSTAVEVTLQPDDGGTLLRLVHHDLPESEVRDHTAGWQTLLARLEAAARG